MAVAARPFTPGSPWPSPSGCSTSCALCSECWPQAPSGFMNSLFHGTGFSSMVQSQSFAWSGLLVALLLLSGWALLAGTFFAWLRNRLAD